MKPRVGSRVWTIVGYQQHGPMEGPLVDVPPNTGGVITSQESRFGSPLFRVQWDSGQRTAHYENGLCCIGTFQTLQEMAAAIRDGGRNARVHLGPGGGLREFTMEVAGDPPVSIGLTSEQSSTWRNVLEPLLQDAGIEVAVTQEEMAPRPKAKRRR